LPEQTNGSVLAHPDGIVTPRSVKPATRLPGASVRSIEHFHRAGKSGHPVRAT
jgi:hypothetical protein